MEELTLKEVQAEIKELIEESLKKVEAIVANRYQIKDFDACLASDDTEKCTKKLAKLYSNAILNDREWVGTDKAYSVEVYFN